MTSRLVTENKLFCQTNNVWSVKESEEPDTFLYTDGDQQEAYIYNVLLAAEDLSSFSDEPDNRIDDWSSEVHLSSKRSNILRGIDFSDVNNVLEIGSGCGAISRYLGEQGVQLDAVEGSTCRAEITRMRCRDMGNVYVSNVPFGALDSLANSFLIVLGENPDVVRKTMSFDFVHFPGHSRKQQHRMIICKEKNDTLVYKLPLFDTTSN